MTLSTRGARPAARWRRDDGAALVEFALISVLLLTIVFAIINLGLVLSFKQDVTRAAAEGARAAAVALPSTVQGTLDPRRLAGETAVQEAVDSFNQDCGVGGMTCASQIHDCTYTVAITDLNPTPDSNGYKNNAEPDCVTVKVRYNYEDYPLLVPVPLISAFLPDEVNAASVVRLNE